MWHEVKKQKKDSQYGIVAAGVGWIFIFLTKSCKKVFDWKTMPIYIKMLIGGILLGLISYAFPVTRYFSHYEINDLMNNSYTIAALTAILVLSPLRKIQKPRIHEFLKE